MAEDFLFGVSDSGFQCEGGYNGAGEPQNNWAAWERSGRAAATGHASDFWDRYPEHLDRAAEIGCGGYRLGVEWTRCEPQPGIIDETAVSHYAEILRACTHRGIEPVVALHHFCHPAWLGPDFWLDDDSPRQFASWVEAIVPHIAPWCSRWTTINEINAYAIGTYLIGYFPPGHRLRRRMAVRAMANMLAAHVLAYDIIHRHRPDAQVGTSTYAFWAYDVDRLLVDLLLTREQEVSRSDLDEWIHHRRVSYHHEVTRGLPALQRLFEVGVNNALATYLPQASAFSAALDAVSEAMTDRSLDVVQLNYYDPRLSNYLRMPGRRTGSGRRWRPDPAHWEQRPAPEHLLCYLRANQVPGCPIWMLENGLCNQVTGGVAQPRPDGWTRPRYLREHLRAVARAVDAGVDVRAYFHWCLFDSYQWGEYDSRFGLCEVVRENGEVKLGDTDSMGHDAAGEYQRLIEELGPRAGLRAW